MKPLEYTLDGDVIRHFESFETPLAIFTVLGGAEFVGDFHNHVPVFVFIGEHSSINLEIVSREYRGVITLVNQHFAIIRPHTRFRITSKEKQVRFNILFANDVLYPRILKACEIKKKHYESLFSKTHIFTAKVWINELVHRYVFERIQAKKSKSYVTHFLEIEIMKEIHFNTKDQLSKKGLKSFAIDHFTLDNRPASLKKAIEYIEKNLFKHPRLDQIAEHAGTSRATLLRLFKRELKASPYGYVQDRILNEAQLLLASGKTNVAETALIVGYATPSAFTYAFKKKYGHLPKTILLGDHLKPRAMDEE